MNGDGALWFKRPPHGSALGACDYNGEVKNEPLAGWSPEQIAAGKRWVQAWKEAGPRLEQVRREELRRLDPQRAIALVVRRRRITPDPRVLRGRRRA